MIFDFWYSADNLSRDFKPKWSTGCFCLAWDSVRILGTSSLDLKSKTLTLTRWNNASLAKGKYVNLNAMARNQDWLEFHYDWILYHENDAYAPNQQEQKLYICVGVRRLQIHCVHKIVVRWEHKGMFIVIKNHITTSTSIGANLCFRNLFVLYAITIVPHLYGAPHIRPLGSNSPLSFLHNKTWEILRW